jgi:hypothetical protein
MMKKSLAQWLVIYGVFLILAGVAGFLSNPEKAKTALMSGGTFGSLSIAWGILNARGVTWSRTAALVTLGFLCMVFTWRSAAGWIAVAEGRSEKLFAACLISLMLGATAAMLTAMLRKKV